MQWSSNLQLDTNKTSSYFIATHPHAHTHTAPCRQERRTNENIECDRMGRFEPLQCEPIEGPTGTTTSDGQTESMRLPMQCRCVDLTTGDTLLGSERRVEPRDRMPDCRGRGKVTDQ